MVDDTALTLGELVDEAARQLAEAGVDDADISARRIGETAAGVEPSQYLASRDTALTTRMVAHADEMLGRRAAGEPLQYVVGSWSFRGVDLAVDSRALIPRPETEVVAGVGISILGDLGRPSVAVDLGTGSGAIALAIAQEVRAATVLATDIDGDALALARSNLAGLGMAAARVKMVEGRWFDALDSELFGALDLVISNPPYVPDGADLPEVVAGWEPARALFSGPNGTDDLTHLVVAGRQWLRPGGSLVLEGSPEQMPALVALASRRGYVDVRVIDDLSGRGRGVVARRPNNEPSDEEVNATREVLQSGGLAVAPTDTVPGLLARYDDVEAVREVYRHKRRPYDQPLPILVSGVEQARRLVELDDASAELAQRHWPGGLTIVAPRRGGPDPVHGGDTLGVRVPATGWLLAVIDDVGPLTGSSANLHGEETPLDAAEAAAMLGVSAWVNGSGGDGVPSTVIRVMDGAVEILRQGAVTVPDKLPDS